MMRKLTLSITLLLMVITSLQLTAQRNCGSMDMLEIEQQDPKQAERLRGIERHTQRYIKDVKEGRASSAVVTIPIVFHVVYRTAAENLSDAEIMSQLQVLNDDFRRLNSDANNTWSQAVDTEIQFCLATTDPNGNATSGITRTQTTVNGFGTNDAVKFSAQGGKDAWPSSDYLNFWVCNIGGGILGYAQFPGGNAATDGVVNGSAYTGTIGSSAPFNLGRTATHEVGHWLNLRHIWGDGGCGVDDFVSDTPESDASNFGCATGHVSCGSTDMVQNYMDYSDDVCMNLFTAGQKARMQALFAPGGARASILNSTACGNAPEPTCTDGTQNGDETGVDCGGATCPACPAEPTCNDGIQNGDETGVDCGGSTCAACPCNGNGITISITLDNYPEETSWTINDANGSSVASGGTYAGQADGSTVTENVCLPDGCYDFVINDGYGDGICCQYGTGSYNLTDESGSSLASGGEFTNSETTNFCVGGGAGPTCSDGTQNGDETGVDCGGSSCPACPTCDDGVQNGDETGVDCGGSCAPCISCDDGVQNGDEAGVDCGGSSCPACPTCDDGVQNGSETGVDCGGNCPACPSGCTENEVNVAITFDNYPGEISWEFVADDGTVAASGGNYTGASASEDVCLPDGCYHFVISDSYGDGLCCQYGNGSYSVTDASGTLASGAEFTTGESTYFCLGDTPPGPTCDDGVQNGDETGVDCGGSSCTPCDTGDCTFAPLYYSTFENGWQVWNDGGIDARRSSADSDYAVGNYCLRLRDNTSTSVITTDSYDFSGYDELKIDFTYIARSMEAGEDFWLQLSTDGGATYSTEEAWVRGIDFSNLVRKNEAVTIAGPFSANTRLRFRCDASANNDMVYLDNIRISGCSNGNLMAPSIETPFRETEGAATTPARISDINVFPNPANEYLNVEYVTTDFAAVQVYVIDVTGKIVGQQLLNETTGEQRTQLDISQLSSGFYFIQLVSENSMMSKKFVKQ